MSHSDDDTLRRWLDDQLAPAAAANLKTHLANCKACADQVEKIANRDLPAVLIDPVRVQIPAIERRVLREVRAKTLFEDLMGLSTTGLAIFLTATLVPVAALLKIMLSEPPNPRKDDD